MLVDVAISHPDMTDVYTLNETAASVWSILSEGLTEPEKIAAKVCEEYEVDYATSLGDVKALISSWVKSGLLAE